MNVPIDENFDIPQQTEGMRKTPATARPPITAWSLSGRCLTIQEQTVAHEEEETATMGDGGPSVRCQRNLHD